MKCYDHYLLLLLLSLIFSSSCLISANEYTCQNNTSCGDIEIAYPFWVAGESDYYCGYPDLKVTCEENKTLTFQISTNNYIVKNITYGNKTLSLVDADVVSESCPRVRHNVNISSIPILGYEPGVNVNLTFFFNCPWQVPDDYLSSGNQSTCLDSNTTDNYIFIGGEVESYQWLLTTCDDEPVVAPVLNDGWNRSDVDELFPERLKEGFQLQWDGSGQTKNCTDCQNSQGMCGQWNETGNGYGFYCFCKDGTRLKAGICPDDDGKSNKVKIIIGGASAGLFLCLVVVGVLVCIKRKNSSLFRRSLRESLALRNGFVYSDPYNTSFQFMDITTIKAATNNFLDANKLGQGGFGTVYKGTLRDGTEIAIKRLSITSTQGSEEFKNEVKLISRLQHKNLVKLLGYCTDDDEKLLIYEYLPNGSLDAFIFDPSRRSSWEWSTITHIILGITRGLLYLHEVSRLRVVHRDMKPGNILLDLQMNPKISDFGLARIFDNRNELKTHKIVGTFGYMAPEFAMSGVFSTKSDIFSFGVILLEIIGGNKNGSSYFIQQGQSLLSKAWNLWRERRGLEFIDPTIVEHHSFQNNKIVALRCINIALLCIQDNPVDRPTMSMVLRMLTSEHTMIPEPKQPPSIFMHEDGSIVQRNH